MKCWVSLVGWPTADSLPTLSGHPSAAGRAHGRESSSVKDQRSTTVPRNQPGLVRSMSSASFSKSPCRVMSIRQQTGGLRHGGFYPEGVWSATVCSRHRKEFYGRGLFVSLCWSPEAITNGVWCATPSDLLKLAFHVIQGSSALVS